MKNNYISQWSFIAFIILASSFGTRAQHSVARQWNEALLHAIRNDFARPTVHARNLWHTSIAMYDSWAVYTNAADNYFLGDTVGEFYCPFNGIPTPADIKAAQEETMSYAAYRLLHHRFQQSPNATATLAHFDSVFNYLGYDPMITSVNYAAGDPAALGNFIAQELIAFGLQDSSNEQNGYANVYYQPVNGTLLPVVPGNPNITDPNRWQPLTLNVFIDQSGNVIPISTPSFLSPEWGWVTAFALDTADMDVYTRDGNDYPRYHNALWPPLMDTINGGQSTINYEWGFSLVAKWSSHLDTTDNVMWDISPNSIGNVPWYPSTMDSLPYFYDMHNGGDNSQGYSVNPATGLPYAPQMVRRGDYARVLAEFWADGPDSETPPGHWFTILNYVNDHAQFQKKWKGQGPVLDDLEWDVKAYFTLSGAVHDAAVASWGLKGYHDYLRPISAIRYMADRGQSSDTSLPSYDPWGIKLDSGFVELVDSLDPLADSGYVNVGKIKIKAWAGPDSITDPNVDMAGVDWILAENWWPYQRPTFVTPPFAGFVSGHSTFSRAAAEVMGMMTGDEYFPGGMGEFHANKNDFLVFEEGPSQNVVLQWAKYIDASDQCSLSRIWGGIHPPADDIPGRLIGMEIGIDAFNLAKTYWENGIPDVIHLETSVDMITDTLEGPMNFNIQITFDSRMDTLTMPQVGFPVEDPTATLAMDSLASMWVDEYTFMAVYDVNDSNQFLLEIDIEISGAKDDASTVQTVYTALDQFDIDMENPHVAQLTMQPLLIADKDTGVAKAVIIAEFNELLDTALTPVIQFPVENPLQQALIANVDSTGWMDSVTYRFSFDVVDSNFALADIDIRITGMRDWNGNDDDSLSFVDHFSVDTENPWILSIVPSVDTIMRPQIGTGGFTLTLNYNEDMDTTSIPNVSFPVEDPLAKTLSYTPSASYWANPDQFVAVYDVDTALNTLLDIDVRGELCFDVAGNMDSVLVLADLFHINILSNIGLPENVLAYNVELYPNPVKIGTPLSIGVDNLQSKLDLQLYDMHGKLVFSTTEDATAKSVIEISTDMLPVGAYLLHMGNEEFQTNLKIIVIP